MKSQKSIKKSQGSVLKYNFQFPSYNNIQRTIIAESKAVYNQTLSRLSSKIEKIKSSINIEDEHTKIKEALLSLDNQQLFAVFGIDPNGKSQQLKWDRESKSNFGSRISNKKSTIFQSTFGKKKKTLNLQQSLNCCLQDDIQEQNHYQSYMKFRKRILQRQLEEEENQNQIHPTNNSKNRNQKRFGGNSGVHTTFMNSIMKMKENQQYEHLFKTLYAQQQKLQKSNIRRHRTNDANSINKTKTSLTSNKNANTFLQCQKNKSILIGNYSKYLKDLSKTNIIKWRILDETKPDRSSLQPNRNNSIISRS